MVSPRNTSSAILQIINHSASACSGLFWEISPLTALGPSKSTLRSILETFAKYFKNKPAESGQDKMWGVLRQNSSNNACLQFPVTSTTAIYGSLQ